MAQRSVRIEDVARAANVSITTVSHALSGRGQVAAATAERVRQAASELGYSPNRLASALRSRRSQSLGFVSDDIATTPFATRVVLGAQHAAAEHNQLLVVVSSDRQAGVESLQIDGLLAAQIDALVYARMFHQASEALPLALRRVPTVLLDTIDPEGEIPAVVPDEAQIARLATRTLIDAGHTRIAHLTVARAGSARDQRRDAYLAEMHAAGLDSLVFEAGERGDSFAGRTAFAQMLASGIDDITALFCFNDPMAMGVYQAAIRAGVRIPRDLSVVAVDDFEPVAAALLPGLTTVALPHYEMGRWGVETALKRLDNPDAELPALTLLPGALVERESVTRPRDL